MFEEQTEYGEARNPPQGLKAVPTWRVSQVPELNGRWEIAPIFPFGSMWYLMNKGITVPDIAQAVLNAKNTANTDIQYSFVWRGAESDERKTELYKKAIKYITEWSDYVYPGSNLHGLVDDLIGSVHLTGAMCVEWVLSRNRDRVERALVLETPTLRWLADSEYNLHLYQSVPHVQIIRDGQKRIDRRHQWVSLNYDTVVYRALQRYGGNPYGIPQISSVLKVLPAHELSFDNISKTIGKYGLMGFLIVKFMKRDKRPDESMDSYREALISELDMYYDKYKDMFTEGVAVGYDGESEIDIKDVTGNTEGVSQIIQLVEEQMMSALNQDPALAGRTYSTTETYAGVVYDKYLRGISRIQSCVQDCISRGVFLHLAAMGMPIESVKVRFTKAKSLTNKMDAEARFMEQKVSHELFSDGIIDQTRYANEMGYDQPDQPEPRYPYVSDIESQAEVDGDKALDQKKDKNGVRQTKSEKEVGVTKTEPRRTK